ncbi:membrane protein insertase YidC [Candidatus Azambacteria bacterium]|nr:membrane protein insertase YidC [Candidatus Azambacteria bacterium]
MLGSLFNEVFYRPLFNALVGLYQTAAFYDLGIAIIILTVLLRLALWPLASRALRSQKELMALQPEIKKIQEQYKNNKDEQMKRVMALYKEKKVNPFSGFLPILIQLPVLFALYRVFFAGFKEESLNALYGFIPNPGAMQHFFVGMVDLAATHNVVLAVMAGALQFYQSRMMLKDQQKRQKGAPQNDFSAHMSKQMVYVMPAVIAFTAYILPAGIALYLAVTTGFSIMQQLHVLKSTSKEEAQ